MTHPIFRQDLYIETPFEIRFHAMLRYAWHKRSWHVIVADPESGKTVGARDMIKVALIPERGSSRKRFQFCSSCTTAIEP